MDITGEIGRIERRLSRAGVPLAAFRERCGIHRKTWERWRTGDMPSLRLWLRVQAEFTALKAETKRAA